MCLNIYRTTLEMQSTPQTELTVSSLGGFNSVNYGHSTQNLKLTACATVSMQVVRV